MAGSDKKEQQLESKESASGGAEPLKVQDPDVSHIVLAGAPLGLIPRASLDTDQEIRIGTWGGSLPTNPIFSEKFMLQIARRGSSEWTTIGPTHTYVGGSTWVPLIFTLPSSFMLDTENEGAFDLRYMHTNYLDVDDYSERVPIHIDKVPPNGALPPARMGFTVTPPIKDTTFGTDDYLEATIPSWTGDVADVQVAFAWLKGQLPDDPEKIEFMGPLPIIANGKVRIPKDKFIEAGDGECCGGYVLIDKAGNISALSLYELMSVALGPLPPVPLSPAPIATDATGGELLRSDIVDGGVIVTFARITNGKSTDDIAMRWGGREVDRRIPVDDNPAVFSFFVPWSHIRREYGASKGVVDTDLQFIVYRGVEAFESVIATVKCNFSHTGPENPNPGPGNPNLKPVTVVGKSGVDNKLVAGDEDEEVKAYVELVSPLNDGDTLQAFWNETPIGAPYIVDVTKDSPGDVVEIPLDWDVIRREGPSATMPVWYVLTNEDHENPQEPDPRTSVDVSFLVIKLPAAQALYTTPGGILSCNSLRWNATSTTFGIEFLIPPSEQLKAGVTVEVEWKAFKDMDNPEELPGAYKKTTFTDISESQATNGIVWMVEPYATHILPTWSKDTPVGVCEVTYTIVGKPASAPTTSTLIGMSQGEGSCNLPRPPNP